MSIKILQGILAVFSLFFLFSLAACDFSPYAGEATLAIDLHSLFAAEGQDGRVAGVPPNINQYITSVSVTISGAGMNKTTYNYSSSIRYIYLNVPAGSRRTIGLELNIDPDSPLPVYSYGGETTLTVKPGKITMVDIPMAPTETKIVIPDRNAAPDPRLVQIPNMTPSPSQWRAITGYNFYDVDFDNLGIIYIVNNANPDPDVVRMYSLDDAQPDDINDAGVESCSPIAVDRVNKFVYYSVGGTLRRSNLDGTSPTTIDTTNLPLPPITETISTIRGIAVDEEGILYIVGNNAAGLSYVFRYDVDNVVLSEVQLDFAVDVIVKGDYIYVTCSNSRIMRYTKELGAGTSFGVAAAGADDRTPGHFYGPARFVATLNKKFYVIDDGSSDIVGEERLVAFDEVGGAWSGWQVFRENDIHPGFDFTFYGC